MCLADAELRRVVARDPLDGRDGVFAGNFNLAHVADIEDGSRGAHRHVLAGNAGVLDGHLPAGKRHHPGVQCTVTGVEWSLSELGGSRVGHGAVRIVRVVWIVRAFDTFVNVADVLIVLDVRIVHEADVRTSNRTMWVGEGSRKTWVFRMPVMKAPATLLCSGGSSQVRRTSDTC